MKKINNIFIVTLMLVMAFGCEYDLGKFSSEIANVSFTESTLSIKETDGSIKVPVVLANEPGEAITVEVEVDAENTTAVEGVNYTITSGLSLTFEEGTGIKYVVVSVVDNDVFTGDTYVTLKIKSTSKELVNNPATSAKVSIVDDEHPLKLVIGDFDATATDFWGGADAWTVTFEADPDNLDKLLITNFVNGGANLKVSCDIDLENGTIKIPVGQDIVASDANPAIIAGWYGPDGEVDIDDHISGTIDENGTIVLNDWFGSMITEGGNEGLFFNGYAPGVTFTKK